MAKKQSIPKINCCESCQYYWTCEEKWYRGERNEENICCNLCNFYTVCIEKAQKSTKKSSKKTSKKRTRSL